jgi:hypothetical protein
MGCRVKNGKAILPSGKESNVFNALNDATKNVDEATTLYEQLHSKSFKDWYGENWELKYDVGLFTDENGEPKIEENKGYYSIMNKKQQEWRLPIKNREKSSSLIKDRDLQNDLIDTLVGFINKVRDENPGIFKTEEEVEAYFGLDEATKDKGDLADKVLLEAFTGLNDITKAKELYNILITEGQDAFVEALPEGVGMNSIPGAPNNASQLFIFAYHNWNSTKNLVTKNIEKVGVRDLIKDNLSKYGMKLTDRSGAMEEFDDTPEKIHAKTRLEDNPKDRLSREAKSIIGNIVSGTNSIGYPKLISMDEAYALIAESTVDQPTLKEMLSSLEYRSIYKPELIPIIEKLKKATPQQEAAIFSNFRMSYNNFIMFMSEKIIDDNGKVVGNLNKFIDSNQSNVSKKAKVRFRQISRQGAVPTERALYQTNESGAIESVKVDKLERLKELWGILDNVNQNKYGKWDIESDINALGEYLWGFGMSYGPTLEATQDNLRLYYVNGNEEGLKENNLFSKFVFDPNNNFNKLINSIRGTNPRDIYKEHGTLIDKITELSSLFETRPFGSFITGTNKQVTPVNLSTRLHELTNSINNPKEAEAAKTILNNYLDDPLFRPYGSILYSSPLVTALHNSVEAQQNFVHEVLDSYKASDELIATSDYKNQSARTSLIIRLLAFRNNDTKNNPYTKQKYTRIAIPTQAGRSSLDFKKIPRTHAYKKHFGVEATRTQLLEGIILQDLARFKQANDFIDENMAANTPGNLIEGYHYIKGTAPNSRTGHVFTMPQIKGNEALLELSDYIEDFLVDPDFKFTKEGIELSTALADRVKQIEEQLRSYEVDLDQRITDYGIDLINEVDNNLANKEQFIKDFIFEDFIGKIEISKMLRSGKSFAADIETYYKRMALLKTPGNKLFLQGQSESNPEYGMPTTYNAVTIRDFDFVDQGRANEVADALQAALSPAEELALGLVDPEVADIADRYRNVNKSDAQSFISLHMYRNIMQGMGQWDMTLDEQAYQNAVNPNKQAPYAGTYVDNNGRVRPIYPLKPFHEELSLQNGVNTLYMDKNSYTVVTPELAINYPYLTAMFNAMNDGVDVVNTESATKGAKKNIQDFRNNIDETGTPILDTSTPTVMDSSMLRFPQLMPRRKQDEIVFNKQIRKNLVANVAIAEPYIVGDTIMTGAEMKQLYGNAIATNIKEDTKKLDDELGITELKRLKGRENTPEHREAKLNYLQNVREKLVLQIKERDLSDNYLDALDIVIDGPFNYRFNIPLAFPNYQAKFEGIFMSMYNNELFNQKLKGKEMVQVAELGGHRISGELEFYDGSNPAQIRIKASALGLDPNTDISQVPEEKLQVIGYRIPQQGKNSALFMQVVDFLPESHEKAVMVPGGITVQMGSDFDIDKLYLIMQETDVEGNVIKPNYDIDSKNMNRQERNNVIFDTFKSILTSKRHLKEVVKTLELENKADPTKSAEIKKAQAFIANTLNIDTSIDYNNPMAELDMEERAKEGDKLIGLWSNQLAGRNEAEGVQILEVKSGYLPNIDGIEYVKIGRTLDDKGRYTDYIIQQHQSAAVDYAKDPFQIEINDNIYTNPVLGLFYSLGIPMETALTFVNQPIIREVTDHARVNSITIGKFKQSIDKVAKDYKVSSDLDIGSVQPMFTAELESNLANPDIEKQKQYLGNFYQFFKVGRALQTVNKIISPDKLDNVNELSSIMSFLDTEALYMNNTESLIQKAEDLIQHYDETTEPLSPIPTAYRGIFTTMITEAERVGFINNSPAFKYFKSNLREATGSSTFTADQHKMIDRALFLKIMTQPNSPLVNNGIISGETFDSLYTNPNDNIITKLTNLQAKYPQLNNNVFIQALEIDPSNVETNLFLLKVDIPFGASTADKNNLTDGLRDLLYSNLEGLTIEQDQEIQNFGKLLIANQFLTSGYIPTHGSYIDLIPSEVLTTDKLNRGQNSPVEFFEQEMEELRRDNYFNDFVHEFIRTYGTSKPGGVPILDVINKVDMDKDGFVSIEKGKPELYGNDNKNLQYFLSYATGQANIFVFVDESNNFAKYRKLLPLGHAKKLNESGISLDNSTSLVNFAANVTTNKPAIGKTFEKSSPEIIIQEEPKVKRIKDCPK